MPHQFSLPLYRTAKARRELEFLPFGFSVFAQDVISVVLQVNTIATRAVTFVFGRKSPADMADFNYCPEAGSPKGQRNVL